MNSLYPNPTIKMSHSAKTGYLELILGPMFSGKTSKLLQLYKQYIFCNISVVVINYAEDKRYHDTMLSTHDKLMIPCYNSLELTSILQSPDLMKNSVFLINEGQFFPDLLQSVIDLVEIHHKTVYVCGLDGDFKREKFGLLLDLIPYCDEITKLTSFCNICKDGVKGIFTHRLSNEKEQKIIGTDNYIPLCRKCFIKSYNKTI